MNIERHGCIFTYLPLCLSTRPDLLEIGGNLYYSFSEKVCTVRLHLDKLGEPAEPHVEATFLSPEMGQTFSGQV